MKKEIVKSGKLISKKLTKLKTAFTLVELIIVIIILAILATIGFISFMGYTSQARDVVRMQDLQDIQKAIVLYQAKNGEFPEVENAEIKEINGVKWKVGTFGKKAIEELQDISSLPLDPSTNSGYFYMTSESGLSYKLEAKLENNLKNNSNVGDKKLFVLTNYKLSLAGLTNGGGTDTCPTNPTPAKYFKFNKETKTIESFSGTIDGKTITDVIIPCKIDGIDVENIGPNNSYDFLNEKRGFYMANLTSVVIPNSIKNIGQFSFYLNVNLKSVIIPDSVTNIGYYAFNHCHKLTKLIIGKNIKIIPHNVFEKTNIKTVIIPDGITNIGDSAFEDSRSIEKLVIGKDVETIGNAAFQRNKLISIVIPNNVKSIGHKAFYQNKLIEITIPDSVTSIGEEAFSANGPNQNSATITDWTPGSGGTWILNGTTWVKQ